MQKTKILFLTILVTLSAGLSGSTLYITRSDNTRPVKVRIFSRFKFSEVILESKHEIKYLRKSQIRSWQLMDNYAPDHNTYIYRITANRQSPVDGGMPVLQLQQEGYIGPEVYKISPKGYEDYARQYKGTLEFRQVKDELQIIVHSTERDYLASVVYCERVPGSRELSAQEALAVCARSYLRYLRQEHEVLNDLTTFQVFKGLDHTDEMSYRAVEQTRDMIITSGSRRPLPAYYSSTCGEMTAVPGLIWSPDEYNRHFVSVSNSFRGQALNARSPHKSWQAVLDGAKQKQLAAELGISRREFAHAEIDYINGLIREIRFPSLAISGWDFRMAACRLNGWSFMKSISAQISIEENKWIIKGQGLGHSSGFCVYGSDELSKMGLDFREILKFYFPRLSVE